LGVVTVHHHDGTAFGGATALGGLDRLAAPRQLANAATSARLARVA